MQLNHSITLSVSEDYEICCFGRKVFFLFLINRIMFITLFISYCSAYRSLISITNIKTCLCNSPISFHLYFQLLLSHQILAYNSTKKLLDKHKQTLKFTWQRSTLRVSLSFSVVFCRGACEMPD